jgi:hypothetical protein
MIKMGMRSSVVDHDLTIKDMKSFKFKMLTYLWGLGKHFDKETFEPWFNEFNEKEIEDINTNIMAYQLSDYTKFSEGDSLKITDEIYLDFDHWKIQGYWYTPFCAYLYYLWDAGLRGYIKLCYEGFQDYTIKFEEEGVNVDIYEEQEWDEEKEIYFPDEPQLEETFELRDLSYGNKINLPFEVK